MCDYRNTLKKYIVFVAAHEGEAFATNIEHITCWISPTVLLEQERTILEDLFLELFCYKCGRFGFGEFGTVFDTGISKVVGMCQKCYDLKPLDEWAESGGLPKHSEFLHG